MRNSCSNEKPELVNKMSIKSNKQKYNLVAYILCLCFILLSIGCDDPVPGPVGGLVLLIQSTEATIDSKIKSIAEIEINTQKMEVLFSETLGGAERVITIDTQMRTILIANSGISNRLVGQYQVPPGYVSQIRIFPASVILHLKDGTTVPLDANRNIPSWFQSGWKINPIDNTPWPINQDQLTGVRALFSFDEQMHENKGIGYQIKPTVPAVLFPVNPPSEGPGLFMDQLTIVFHDGISRQQIDSINAQIGAWILRTPVISQAYRIKLPAKINLQDAFNYYQGISEVASVLPAVNFGMPDRVPPNEGVQPEQSDNKLPGAWMTVNNRTGRVGDWRVRVADIDSKIDLSKIDLIPNTFINQGEIPANVRARLTDVDGDGLFTFYDLNHSANFTAANRLDILKDRNNNGCFDGFDLLSNPNWVNGIDDDADDQNPRMGAKPIIDDIIGYNFSDNTPFTFSNATIANDLSNATHGTSVSLIMAAAANNQDGRFSNCPYYAGAVQGYNFDQTGAVWNVSLAPLVVATPISGTGDTQVFIPDVALIDALKYAEAKTMKNTVTGVAERTFDIANVEVQYHIIQTVKNQSELYCSDESSYTKNVTRYDVPADVFSTGMSNQRALFEGYPWKLMGQTDSQILYVWAAGNSSFNLASPSILNHVSEMMRESLRDNFIMVGYAETPILSGWHTNYGEGVIDIYAISNSTSLATPIVSGVAALIVSQDPCVSNPGMPCSLRHNPREIKNRIVGRAPHTVVIQSVPFGVAPGQCINLERQPQPIIDANAAVQ